MGGDEVTDHMAEEILRRLRDILPQISVDLDSTLFDTRHRHGIIERYRARGEDVDWTEYALACEGDGTTEFLELLKVMQAYGVPWHVVSGRSEGAREATIRVLTKHDLHPKTITLEGEGAAEEHTAMGHTEFKARQVARLATEYPIVLHVDDWPEVAARVEELTEGRVKGMTVIPPGWEMVDPAKRDGPV